jgi:hydrogenase-4 component B
VTGAVLVGGVVLVAVGASIAPFVRTVVPALVVQALGAVLLGSAGAMALWSDTASGAAFTSGFAPRLGVDALSGVFLLALGLVAAPTLVYACGYLRSDRAGRAIATLTGAFLLALVLVLCARDVTTFLAGWELMTLAPAAIILVARDDAAARRTVFVYVAITHIGGAGVWIALLELASIGGVGDPAAVLVAGSRTQAVIGVAALIGFGTKAGMMPLHPWLPRAHPIAPAPISALMSGIMVKVALYGLVRVLVDWSPPASTWLGVAVLALGGASALGGVTYALFARDLKRLLALSTIENVGIILLALGASLLLRRGGEDLWAAVALAAAMLHAINHAVFKALLFLGAGAIERATGTVDVDSLGGLLRRMPRTGWALVIGAAAIAGLPPLNGFASEWLALRSLLAVAEHLGVGAAIAGAIALAALAMTAALAVFCFVRTVGLVLLGEPRRARAADATEPAATIVAPLLVLAGLCIALGALPGVILPRLIALTPGVPVPAVRGGLDVPGTGSLGTGTILLAIVALTLLLLRARGSATAAPAPSWACGQLVEPALRWSTAGFTKPMRLVLEVALRPVRVITVDRAGGLVRSVTYSGEVPHLVDDHLYRPATRLALASAAAARRLQGGSLGVYVGYLIGLLVGLLAALRLGWL